MTLYCPLLSPQSNSNLHICQWTLDCVNKDQDQVLTHEEVPQTDTVCRMDSLRSKLEQSEDAFIKARKELEEIFSAEGSSEQGHFFTGSSTDLKS